VENGLQEPRRGISWGELAAERLGRGNVGNGFDRTLKKEARRLIGVHNEGLHYANSHGWLPAVDLYLITLTARSFM